MKRGRSKKLNIVLYACLMATIPTMVYLEIHHYFWMSLVLVCVMFAISMVMFGLSVYEHEKAGEKAKQKKFLN